MAKSAYVGHRQAAQSTEATTQDAQASIVLFADRCRTRFPVWFVQHWWKRTKRRGKIENHSRREFFELDKIRPIAGPQCQKRSLRRMRRALETAWPVDDRLWAEVTGTRRRWKCRCHGTVHENVSSHVQNENKLRIGAKLFERVPTWARPFRRRHAQASRPFENDCGCAKSLLVAIGEKFHIWNCRVVGVTTVCQLKNYRWQFVAMRIRSFINMNIFAWREINATEINAKKKKNMQLCLTSMTLLEMKVATMKISAHQNLCVAHSEDQRKSKSLSETGKSVKMPSNAEIELEMRYAKLFQSLNDEAEATKWQINGLRRCAFVSLSIQSSKCGEWTNTRAHQHNRSKDRMTRQSPDRFNRWKLSRQINSLFFSYFVLRLSTFLIGSVVFSSMSLLLCYRINELGSIYVSEREKYS